MGRIQQPLQWSLLGSVGFPIEQEVQDHSLYFSEEKGEYNKDCHNVIPGHALLRHVSLLTGLDSDSYRGSGRKFIMARI